MDRNTETNWHINALKLKSTDTYKPIFVDICTEFSIHKNSKKTGFGFCFNVVLNCGPETLLIHSVRCFHFLPPENITFCGAFKGFKMGVLVNFIICNIKIYQVINSILLGLFWEFYQIYRTAIYKNI